MAKMGRPRVDPARKVVLRYARLEDTLKPVLSQFESENDRLLILKVLEELKTPQKAVKQI